MDTSRLVEIPIWNIGLHRVIGRGRFGKVWRGEFKGSEVAVKFLECDEDHKLLQRELHSLRRVDHPNIIKLLGSGISNGEAYIVMELAEGGSLYQAVHGMNNQCLHYTTGHAMHWMLQLSKGVLYLHSMKPKPIIHRDLKPLNLLLSKGWRELKICDFGSARALQSTMSNDVGSAHWMAPEVFQGAKYSEKCDVYSWGIILWEVLTRKLPYNDMDEKYAILWSVSVNGNRPPLECSWPEDVQSFMTRCWSSNSSERPSMPEVVRLVSNVCLFCKDGDEPVFEISCDDLESRALLFPILLALERNVPRSKKRRCRRNRATRPES